MKRLLFLLLFLVSAGFVSGETLEDLSKDITVLDAQAVQLQKEYAAGKKANDERLRKVEDARARNQQGSVEELMQQAYVAAETLGQIHARIHDLTIRRTQICQRWREEYERTIDRLLQSAQEEKDRKRKGEMGKKLQTYQSMNARLCSESLRSSVSQEWKSLQVEAYDGPAEVRQKIQLLNDISREISINIAKLDQQYQDYQREQRTKERAQEFIQESTLFTDALTVRPATRAEGIGTNMEGSVDHAPTDISTGSAAQILGNSDWTAKLTSEEFETQYQKMRESLLSQQTQLKIKLKEFDERAKALMNP